MDRGHRLLLNEGRVTDLWWAPTSSVFTLAITMFLTCLLCPSILFAGSLRWPGTSNTAARLPFTVLSPWHREKALCRLCCNPSDNFLSGDYSSLWLQHRRGFIYRIGSKLWTPGHISANSSFDSFSFSPACVMMNWCLCRELSTHFLYPLSHTEVQIKTLIKFLPFVPKLSLFYVRLVWFLEISELKWGNIKFQFYFLVGFGQYLERNEFRYQAWVVTQENKGCLKQGKFIYVAHLNKKTFLSALHRA